jgi:hypothetical protein
MSVARVAELIQRLHAVKPVLHFLAGAFSLGLIVVPTVYNSNANSDWYRCRSIRISHGLAI